jgi:hypothetical protein
MTTATSVPAFKWAENENDVFITIEVSDVKDGKVELKKKHLKFTGTSGTPKVTWLIDFELAGDIDDSKSTSAIKQRQVEILLKKDKEGFWKSLTSSADKNKYKGRLKADWDLWRDEDDDEEKKAAPDFGMGGMGGMPGMGGMGGMPGGMGGGPGGMDLSALMAQMGKGGMGGAPGGDDEEEPAGKDSDDDELPDLEDAEAPKKEEAPKAAA